MNKYSHWDEALAKSLIGSHLHLEGAMLPILHSLQEEFGYIDDGAISLLAEALNISKAEVLGTISFYHDFRREPAGKTVIKLCRAEACQSVGCQDLVHYADHHHDLPIDKTSDDEMVTFETVYCLGNCALGPALLVDGELVGRVDRQKMAQLLEQARSKAGGRS